MAEVTANIKDSLSGLNIPVDGVVVPSAAPNPTAGESIRQSAVIGKSDGSANYADPDGAGNLQVNLKASIPLSVTVSSATLPAGAATSANQPALNADGGSLAHITNLPATQPVSGSVSIANFPATQVISATSLPLPTGAAQDGTDGSGISQPAGGVGIRGWLSGIYKLLGGTLNVAVVSGGGGTSYVATANVSVVAGSTAGPAVNTSGHLYSVTVIAVSGGSSAVSITDGSSGPEIAYVPANFPGGDIPMYVPKRFATSLYVNGNSTAPGLSMGYSA